MSNSSELGLTILFDLWRERTTVRFWTWLSKMADNRSKNTNWKKSVKMGSCPARFLFLSPQSPYKKRSLQRREHGWNLNETESKPYPFILFSSRQRSKASKLSAGLAKTTETQIRPENVEEASFLSSPFPSCPALFLFLSPQPPLRKEASEEERALVKFKSEKKLRVWFGYFGCRYLTVEIIYL